jgi:hypothetical protein
MKEINPSQDSIIQQAAEELQAMIRARFPSARFTLGRGEDPEGIYLDAEVDSDDPDEVMDLIVDRLLELQIEEGLPIHVVPLRTPERRQQLIRRQAATRPSQRDQAILGL